MSEFITNPQERPTASIEGLPIETLKQGRDVLNQIREAIGIVDSEGK